MLATLHIENIAVIELADIEFEPGLNLLTGETGAGKSIIIDALSAVLGMRASRDLIRSGHETAKVSAVFTGLSRAAEDFLRENGYDCGGELLVMRELRADGRNVCRVDGAPISVTQLRDLGGLLCNIHGQHDSQALMREETHLGFLDDFGQVDTAAYRSLYDAWQSIERERRGLQMDEEEKARRIDMLSYRLQEWDELALEQGEEETLTARRKLLRNGEKIRRGLTESYAMLQGDEDSQGAVDLTVRAHQALGGIARQDDNLTALEERLGELRYALADCAAELRSFWEDMEDSERELEGIEGRLEDIGRLCRKHNAAADSLFAMAEGWRQELEGLTTGEERLKALEKASAEAYQRLLKAGEALGAQRKKAAKSMEQRMSGELRDLDMAKVRFAVVLEEQKPSEQGMDIVRFLISANAGEPLKPLSKVASGGEMARIMLALKNLLAGRDELGTLVFDEVDSGVSGKAAQRVAQKLWTVSQAKQVLCITHLSQIAAFADSHFRIEKAEAAGRTVTRVVRLDKDGRIGELSRINAGAAITETTRKGAEEMLTMAEEVKGELRGGG